MIGTILVWVYKKLSQTSSFIPPVIIRPSRRAKHELTETVIIVYCLSARIRIEYSPRAKEKLERESPHVKKKGMCLLVKTLNDTL